MDARADGGDTIAAIASAPGGALRAVIRISGPDTLDALVRCIRFAGAGAPVARGVYSGRLDDGRGEQPVLVWWMPGPASYTREDVAELHLPGATPLVACALDRVLAVGARAARPGEFTRRAFERGRLDLTQAEGVLELVAAQTDAERRAGLALLQGGLRERTDELREALAELRALCEASLDFDESDTGHVATDELLELGRSARARLLAALSWEERREPASGRPRVVLVGEPNAGKSALWNALVRHGQALVSEHPGTTRDHLVGSWRAADLACELVDLPGLEPGGDEPDRRAQELAARERARADLLVWVVDACAASDDLEGVDPGLGGTPCGDVPRILAWNQVDRPGASPEPPRGLVEACGTPAGSAAGGVSRRWVATSGTARTGLTELGVAVRDALAGSGAGAGPGPGSGREISVRHRRALGAAAGLLERALEELALGAPLDLVAAGLRGALDALDEITGHTAPEDLLDRIFARFCLGK